MDLAVKNVQEGETFVYVLDNIDWMQGRTQDFLPGGAHRQWGTNNYI